MSPRRERPFPRDDWYGEDERTRRFRLSGQSVARHLELFCEGNRDALQISRIRHRRTEPRPDLPEWRRA